MFLAGCFSNVRWLVRYLFPYHLSVFSVAFKSSMLRLSFRIHSSQVFIIRLKSFS